MMEGKGFGSHLHPHMWKKNQKTFDPMANFQNFQYHPTVQIHFAYFSNYFPTFFYFVTSSYLP